MKMRNVKRVVAVVIAAVGMLSSAATGPVQGQMASGMHGPDVPDGPGGPGWDGRPSHPIHPGDPGPGGPQPPSRPGWNQWHHPPDGRGQRGPTNESSWFQRPYPYHLDYYRMRYGGSYAPYFGNISGPPVIYSPRFGYGPFTPGWGGAYYW